MICAKARFTDKQDGVVVKEFKEQEKTYIYLCLNEREDEEVFDVDGTDQKVKYFEYDYYEFCENSNDIDVEAIKKDPESYVNRKLGTKEMSDKEKIKSLENQITDLQIALCDVYELFGA